MSVREFKFTEIQPKLLGHQRRFIANFVSKNAEISRNFESICYSRTDTQVKSENFIGLHEAILYKAQPEMNF